MKYDPQVLEVYPLEEHVVDVLEEGKNIKWGKLALGMWQTTLFFLFIVVYTIVETLF